MEESKMNKPYHTLVAASVAALIGCDNTENRLLYQTPVEEAADKCSVRFIHRIKRAADDSCELIITCDGRTLLLDESVCSSFNQIKIYDEGGASYTLSENDRGEPFFVREKIYKSERE